MALKQVHKMDIERLVFNTTETPEIVVESIQNFLKTTNYTRSKLDWVLNPGLYDFYFSSLRVSGEDSYCCTLEISSEMKSSILSFLKLRYEI